jgi:hypothetical protein
MKRYATVKDGKLRIAFYKDSMKIAVRKGDQYVETVHTKNGVAEKKVDPADLVYVDFTIKTKDGKNVLKYEMVDPKTGKTPDDSGLLFRRVVKVEEEVNGEKKVRYENEYYNKYGERHNMLRDIIMSVSGWKANHAQRNRVVKSEKVKIQRMELDHAEMMLQTNILEISRHIESMERTGPDPDMNLRNVFYFTVGADGLVKPVMSKGEADVIVTFNDITGRLDRVDVSKFNVRTIAFAKVMNGANQPNKESFRKELIEARGGKLGAMRDKFKEQMGVSDISKVDFGGIKLLDPRYIWWNRFTNQKRLEKYEPKSDKRSPSSDAQRPLDPADFFEVKGKDVDDAFDRIGPKPKPKDK